MGRDGSRTKGACSAITPSQRGSRGRAGGSHGSVFPASDQAGADASVSEADVARTQNHDGDTETVNRTVLLWEETDISKKVGGQPNPRSCLSHHGVLDCEIVFRCFHADLEGFL